MAGKGTKEKEMKIKKFAKLEIHVNLLTEKDEFLVICKEFGSNFPSLRFEEKEWNFLREFVLGDEKKLSLIQEAIKGQSVGEDNQWAAEMNIEKNTSIVFYEISEDVHYTMIPFCSRGNNKRTLRIEKRVFRGQIDPVVKIMIDYKNRLSLEHRDGYIRLYENLKDIAGYKELSLEEVEVSEEDVDYYLSRGLNI